MRKLTTNCIIIQATRSIICVPILWTTHVETVVLLCRKDIDNHIEVKLELDEEDVTKAESKGTYEIIKESILGKYGFKGSTLYIAPVKRNYGLELGENIINQRKITAKCRSIRKKKKRLSWMY